MYIYLLKKNLQLWISVLQRLYITSEESLQFFCLWLKCGGRCSFVVTFKVLRWGYYQHPKGKNENLDLPWGALINKKAWSIKHLSSKIKFPPATLQLSSYTKAIKIYEIQHLFVKLWIEISWVPVLHCSITIWLTFFLFRTYVTQFACISWILL